jgi:hypothetical protein
VKIYVAAVEALMKKKRGGGQKRMKLYLPPKMAFLKPSPPPLEC